MFSLDFLMLKQDLGKFQKHCCLHASRMHCSIYLLVKLQLVKEVYKFEFYHYKYTTILRHKLEII